MAAEILESGQSRKSDTWPIIHSMSNAYRILTSTLFKILDTTTISILDMLDKCLRAT